MQWSGHLYLLLLPKCDWLECYQLKSKAFLFFCSELWGLFISCLISQTTTDAVTGTDSLWKVWFHRSVSLTSQKIKLSCLSKNLFQRSTVNMHSLAGQEVRNSNSLKQSDNKNPVQTKLHLKVCWRVVDTLADLCLGSVKKSDNII